MENRSIQRAARNGFNMSMNVPNAGRLRIDRELSPRRPKTLSWPVVPTYTLPLTTVGRANFTATPGLSQAQRCSRVNRDHSKPEKVGENQ